MHTQPTVAVQVVIPNDARASISSFGIDAVTVHVAGPVGQPSLHWTDLEHLERWVNDLRASVTAEKVRRADIRLAMNEARRALDGVGAQSTGRASVGIFDRPHVQ